MKFKFKNLLIISSFIAPVVISSCSNHSAKTEIDDNKNPPKQTTPSIPQKPSTELNPSDPKQDNKLKVYKASDQKTKISVANNQIKLNKKFDENSIKALKEIIEDQQKNPNESDLEMVNSNLTNESYVASVKKDYQNLKTQEANSLVINHKDQNNIITSAMLILDQDFSSFINLIKVDDKPLSKKKSLGDQQYYIYETINSNNQGQGYIFYINKINIDEKTKTIKFNLIMKYFYENWFDNKWQVNLGEFSFIEAF
ncbi:hypothetical protein [Mycoplasma sp. E35C]|uniref:hypothetical protein n=1 Tax=Mycoplasma sp. E35C TaxID=2801918 RepID=UPI001CA44D7F|nr:hypothetical protein [Mycoplasma sp. E35C]QZX48852.1 hypothetical protein JJE79_02205 [Mycoplasma sp. E35C]